MSDDPEYVGGSTTTVRQRLRFYAGVVVGTVVRAAEWAVPARVEGAVKRLLP